MKSANHNQTPFVRLLCELAGIICFARAISLCAGEDTKNASFTLGERQGVSPPRPSPVLESSCQLQFTSLSPRYVTKGIADIGKIVAKDPDPGDVTTNRGANMFRQISHQLRIIHQKERFRESNPAF